MERKATCPRIGNKRMIPKTCKMSDRSKLWVVLNHYCSPPRDGECKGCSYFDPHVRWLDFEMRANHIIVAPEIAKYLENLHKKNDTE